MFFMFRAASQFADEIRSLRKKNVQTLSVTYLQTQVLAKSYLIKH